jgi:hypothetical protein
MEFPQQHMELFYLYIYSPTNVKFNIINCVTLSYMFRTLNSCSSSGTHHLKLHTFTLISTFVYIVKHEFFAMYTQFSRPNSQPTPINRISKQHKLFNFYSTFNILNNVRLEKANNYIFHHLFILTCIYIVKNSCFTM